MSELNKHPQGFDKHNDSFSFKENTPFTKAEEYFPFKLQFISFLINFDPLDKMNVSEILLLSCSILLNEYLILLLFKLSILKFLSTEFFFKSKL